MSSVYSFPKSCKCEKKAELQHIYILAHHGHNYEAQSMEDYTDFCLMCHAKDILYHYLNYRITLFTKASPLSRPQMYSLQIASEFYVTCSVGH